jgi:hypothetical protein
VVTVGLSLGPGLPLKEPAALATPATGGGVDRNPQVSWNDGHGVSSKPLRDLASAPFQGTVIREPHRVGKAAPPATKARLAAVQTGQGTVNAVKTGISFPGISTPSPVITGTPPDNNIAVSPTQLVEVVNGGIQVFDKKNGNTLLAAKSLNTLWSGYAGTNAGNSCATLNDGDPVVRYDTLAQRWVVSQFSLPNMGAASGPSYECVAVSKTSDATGVYFLYDFRYDHAINDYPKLGVWSDGYYISFNMFGGSPTYPFVGAALCAYEKAAMVLGQPARQTCFQRPNTEFGYLPPDVTGPTAPPAGEPGYFVSLGPTDFTSLSVQALHVDWVTPGNSTLTSSSVTVPAYQQCLSPSGRCVPQPGGAALDSVGDRLMFPLTYRNLGGQESLVVNHTVDAGGGVMAPRWYELRVSGGGLVLHQSGTYAPADGLHRWMGSAAMDSDGNLALGYSASDSTHNPSIRFTARSATDPLGQLTEIEGTLAAGAGVQPGGGRWGDYTSLQVDPADDCTFWFVDETYPSGATLTTQWQTTISSFKFSTCVANDFTVSAPATLETRNRTASAKVTTAVRKGAPGTVNISVTGLPAGVTYTASPTVVAAGSSSTLTFDAAGAAPGSYPLQVVGTSASATHSVPLTLVVTDDFAVSVTPAAVTVAAPTSVSLSTVALASWMPSLDLGLAGLPPGLWATITPSSVTAGNAATLTFDPGTATGGTYPITVFASSTSPAVTRSTSLSVTIPDEFRLAASSAAGTVLAPTTAQTTITPTQTSGSAHDVSLTVSGLPAGASSSFSVNPVPPGGSSVLTLNPGTAAGGTHSLTVTGTDTVTATAHTATYAFTIADDFALSAGPTALLGNGTTPVTSGVTTARASGSAHTLAFSVTGLPAGASGSAPSVTAGSPTTLTLSPGTAATGSYPITLIATDTATGAQHSVGLTYAIDRTAPSAVVTSPTAPFTLASSVRVGWSGSDAGSGIASYDVRYARAPYNGGLSAWPSGPPAGWGRLTGTSKTASRLAAGSTYCFEVRAVDRVGNVSRWSAPRCTAIPLDDRALTASSGWSRITGRGPWAGTLTRSSALNASLTRTGAQLDRIALVFTRCSTCGTVGVYVRGALVAKVSTSGRSASRVVVVLRRFSLRTGPVTLKVLTRGKPVLIDGLGLTRF